MGVVCFFIYKLNLKLACRCTISDFVVRCCVLLLPCLFCVDEHCNPGWEVAVLRSCVAYLGDGDEVLDIWRLGYRADNAWSKKKKTNSSYIRSEGQMINGLLTSVRLFADHLLTLRRKVYMTILHATV